MQLLKLNVSLRATLALFIVLLVALPVFGQPSGDPRVREAQTLLSEQNYSPGPVDGILGPRTLSAILRFQIDQDLPPTRELDDVTLEALRAAAAGPQDEAKPQEPIAASAQTSSSRMSTEAPSTPTESAAADVDSAEGASLNEPRETEIPPTQAVPKPETGKQTPTIAPLQDTEVPPNQSLAEADQEAALGSETAQGSPAETPEAAEPLSESFLSLLPSEFSIENALFIGLLVFAAVAVMAAIYTSIRGREVNDSQPQPDADDETVIARAPEQDLEATVIAPVEPTVTAPPEPTVAVSREENTATAATELVSSYTEGSSPEEVTQAVRAELFADPELEPEPKIRPEKAERDSSGRDEQPQEDPLADLNVYLAFERFDQAEALVKDAIDRYPQRYEYLLRLLEVYVAARNPLAFEFHARALRDAVGANSPLMATALRWWDTISPERPLFEEPLEEETRRV